MRVSLSLTAVLVMTLAVASFAGEDSASASAMELPGLAEPDTVRTNLWLTEALMGEIVTFALEVLPPAPGAVLLVNNGGGDSDDLFGVVASGILKDRGYEQYVVARDSLFETSVDYVLAFEVLGVELSYPEVGRTLGIWQRWVERDVTVTASLELSAASSGQLLFKDNVKRRFSDRIDSDDFEDVDSDLYNFTTAQKAGSGWQNRTEEIVVLGTLAALIAIYFANTGN